MKDAITAHHTFMIYGKSRVIRDCMLKRGWREKFYRKNSSGIINHSALLQLRIDFFTLIKKLYFTEQMHFIIYILFLKIIIVSADHFSVDSSPVILLAGIGDLKDEQNERLLISRMLTNHTVDFLWNTGSDWPGWPAQDNKITVFNRYCRAGFTSKVSLANHSIAVFLNSIYRLPP